MEPTAKGIPRTRIILTWLFMVGMIVFFIAFFFLWQRWNTPAPPEDELEKHHLLLHVVFFLFAGGFFLVAGVIAYLGVIFTGCLTFDYRRPVWNAVKTKQYFANIIVTVALGLGAGFILSAFLYPVLSGAGLDQGLANMLPIIVALVVLQIMQLWVLIWSPVEKRIITKRLAALGITPAHLQGATLVGLSNPASGITKRFAAIEEDLGGLWLTPDCLMFRGDVEQFDLRRDQIVQIERKADNRSTTVLAGITHVVLHVRLPDGNVRQIRLHVEALWTMGRKKRGMDKLANAINQWYAQTNAVTAG